MLLAVQLTVVHVLLLCQKSAAAKIPLPGECYVQENKIEAVEKFQPEEEYEYFYSYRTLDVKDSSAECTRFTSLSDRDLFPFKQPYNLLSIVFQKSNLSLVPTGVFDTFSNLTSLNMQNNFVKVIYPGAFTGLISLKALYLEGNEMVKVSRGVLNSLSRLQNLFLNNNKITDIEEYAFTGLSSLEHLHISGNNLKFLLPTTFDSLKALKTLNISRNSLEQFDVNPIPSLINCDISFNALTEISLNIFSSHLSELRLQYNQINIIASSIEDDQIKYIDLSHNNLSDIFSLGSAVTYLDLSENKLTFLNFSMFGSSVNLETLYLSYNSISNLTEELPDTLLALKNVYLRHNDISAIPVGFFRNLKNLLNLDLSNNRLSQIDYGTLTSLASLRTLDLSNNKLSHLYEGCLYGLSSLTDLFLQYNHLSVLDLDDLRVQLKSLKIIGLEGNDWNCRFLSNLVTNFRVTIIPGFTTKTPNVHGIACRSYSAEIDRNIEKNNTHSCDSVSALSQYFDKGFFSSNFYKYFEKWSNVSQYQTRPSTELILNLTSFDDNFTKSEFYKFFSSKLQTRINSAMLAFNVDKTTGRTFAKAYENMFS